MNTLYLGDNLEIMRSFPDEMRTLDFKIWLVKQMGGYPNYSKVKLGIDGRSKDGLPIFIERKHKVGRPALDGFNAAVQRFYSDFEFNEKIDKELPVGIFVAYSFGRGFMVELERMRTKWNTIIEIKTIDEILKGFEK